MENYRVVAVKELINLIDSNKGMSLGEVLYSFMRSGVLETNTEKGRINFLRDSSDEQLYAAIEETIKDTENEEH